MMVMGCRLGNVLVRKLDEIEDLAVGRHFFVFTSTPVILLVGGPDYVIRLHHCFQVDPVAPCIAPSVRAQRGKRVTEPLLIDTRPNQRHEAIARDIVELLFSAWSHATVPLGK